MNQILALDAGFTHIGAAVIEGGKPIYCHCLVTVKTKQSNIYVGSDDAFRIKSLTAGLKNILKKFPQIKVVCGELSTGGSQSARAARGLALGTAVCVAFAEMAGLPAVWVTPNQVKEVGLTDTSKASVEAGVLRNFPDAPLSKMKDWRNHEADAIAAYLAAKNSDLIRMCEL